MLLQVYRHKQTLSHPHLVLLAYLRKSVGVDEMEQSPEHSRLHVIDQHTSDSSSDVGVPWSEELGHEGLGPGGEHALVRQEQLTTDLKFHICSHLAS